MAAETKYEEVQKFELEAPAKKGSRKFLYIAACTANLTSYTVGIALGWTSPINTKLESNIEGNLASAITPDQSSWIGSLLPIGAAIGPFVAGAAADRIGRKKTILLSMLPIIIGFILAASATSVLHYYIMRFLCGLTVGAICTVLPIYVAEIAEDEVRGSLSSFMQLFIVTGLLFSFCVGPYVSIYNFNMISTLVPIAFLFVFYLYIPETPHYYIAQKDLSEARASLMQLRSSTREGVEDELAAIKASVEESMAKKGGFSDIFKSVGLKKAFIISMGLMTLQQFSGINIILFYTQSIFTATGSTMPPDYSSIIIGVVQVLASALTPAVVDRKGKRFLLILSGVMMAVSQAALGFYFYLKDGGKDVQSIFWLPVASLVIYMIFYCLGFGPLPWAVLAELFPSDVKSVAVTVTAAWCWFLGFIITKFFGTLTVYIGNCGSFWFLASCCAYGAVFVFQNLPETTGKSLQEIQAILAGRRR